MKSSSCRAFWRKRSNGRKGSRVRREDKGGGDEMREGNSAIPAGGLSGGGRAMWSSRCRYMLPSLMILFLGSSLPAAAPPAHADCDAELLRRFKLGTDAKGLLTFLDAQSTAGEQGSRDAPALVKQLGSE